MQQLGAFLLDLAQGVVVLSVPDALRRGLGVDLPGVPPGIALNLRKRPDQRRIGLFARDAPKPHELTLAICVKPQRKHTWALLDDPRWLSSHRLAG